MNCNTLRNIKNLNNMYIWMIWTYEQYELWKVISILYVLFPYKNCWCVMFFFIKTTNSQKNNWLIIELHFLYFIHINIFIKRVQRFKRNRYLIKYCGYFVKKIPTLKLLYLWLFTSKELVSTLFYSPVLIKYFTN